MSSSEILKAAKRERVGSRFARRLRKAGRIPASIQAEGETPHLDISVGEREFLASRRHHVHLYDIDVEGAMETAIVRELQWDAFGDRLNHIEFKRVQRGVATEASVVLDVVGAASGGDLNVLVNEVQISCIPSLIPNSIEVKVGELTAGDSLLANELELPEGLSLAMDGETVLITISAHKEEVAEPAEGEDALESDGAAPEAPDASDSAAEGDSSGGGEG
ncbi:MAG: 50S ribosomal protein L25 [Planctomycetota bacterium]|jgi:large subunit ribosomal protein L25|nr:50S ribosomal protein L25 [Planctomycetota bacterium]MDP6838617.1 50S ribosomal protein L25 [Planctomycetota bacterium]